MENSNDLEEIWSIFGEEIRENLDLVEDCLLKLANNPQDPDLIAALFRSMHTVKGGARMMGLSALETLAHHAEDLVSLARDEGIPLDEEMIHLLLLSLDHLRQLAEEVLCRRQDVDQCRAAGPVRALEALIAARRAPAGAPGVNPLTQVEPAPAAGLPAAGAAPAAAYVPPPVEIIDLATDPLSVRIFLEMEDEELRKIQAGLETYIEQPQSEALERVASAADSLAYAAGQMGCAGLAEALGQLVAACVACIQQDDSAGSPPVENLLPLLVAVEEAEVAARQRFASLASTPPAVVSPPAAKPPEPPAGETYPLAVKDAAPAPGVPSGQIMQQFLDVIGEMAGDQTTLNQLVVRLSGADLLGGITRILKFEQDPTRALEAYLSQHMQDIAALTQAEHRVSASIGRLQEMVNEMGISIDRTIVDGMVVRIGRVEYLIPIASILRIAGISAQNLLRSSSEGHRLLFQMEEQILPVIDLSEAECSADGLVVVVEGEALPFALRIDELVGQQRALVLPLTGQMVGIRNVSGCFLHGDGKVGMVLDPARIEAAC